MSGRIAKLVTRGYHLAALPRAANRWATGAAYLREGLGARPLSLLGLVSSEQASFRHSEDIRHRSGD